MAVERLFVYGSLRPGESNAHMLAGIEGRWSRGSVRGILHASGTGSAAGYPVVVLDPAGPVIPGCILASPRLHEHWRRLDEFEGPDYTRVLATVTGEDGAPLAAYLYVSSSKRMPWASGSARE